MISENSNRLYSRTNTHFKVLRGLMQGLLFSTVVNLMFEELFRKETDRMIQTIFSGLQ